MLSLEWAAILVTIGPPEWIHLLPPNQDSLFLFSVYVVWRPLSSISHSQLQELSLAKANQHITHPSPGTVISLGSSTETLQSQWEKMKLS